MGNESPRRQQPAIYTPTPPAAAPISRPVGSRPLSRPVAPLPQHTSRPINKMAAPVRRKPRWGRRIAIVVICLLMVLVAVGIIVESSALSKLWSSGIVPGNGTSLAQTRHATLL